MSLKVENLTKRFDSHTVVNNISFATGRTGITGFLGPNGAGKSTTMKMITGYLQQDAGDIEVCGIDTRKGRTAAKKKIGYLPEANPLYYDMFVREYLLFVAKVRQVANAKERIEEVIRLTGLTPEASKKTGQLSKGYKQRVGLAAALLHDPEVLILDEPTSGLDPNQIVEIRNLIRELGTTKSILFSSHILQEVESICDRIIIINKGNVVADDRLENLKLNSSEGVVSIKFAETPGEHWITHLDGIKNVSEDEGTFRIHTDDPEKMKRQIMEFSLKHNLNIVSMDSETQSLEEVFKQLTKK
ncbi:MAG: ATP-binding cassette domain-containing protein [Chitinophagaceae bacterium]|nr:ATP-binding cassette domain-containing protein [Chitinophagaceae bacterium]